MAADKGVFAVKVLGSKLYKRIELTIKNQRRKIVEKKQVLDNGRSYSQPSLCFAFEQHLTAFFFQLQDMNRC